MAKRTFNFPSIRLEEELGNAAMRVAANDDRTLTDYVRRLIVRDVFAHLPSLVSPEEMIKLFRALQRDAPQAGGGVAVGFRDTVFGGE